MTRPATALALLLAALLVLVLAGLALGPHPLSPPMILRALLAPDPDRAPDVILRALRLPRVLAALSAGGALGLAGALMQAVTRNPLADPGILGVNAGAALAVVLALTLSAAGPAQLLPWSLAGAAGGAALAASLGGLLGPARGRADPLRLVLAGAAVSALCLALVQGLVVSSQMALDSYRFWVLGGLDGVTLKSLATVAPILGAGGVLALLVLPRLNALVLGDDLARGLGLRPGAVQLLAMGAVICLAAGTVVMAGPLAFIGLIAPHLARRLAGPDERLRALMAALFGALLLLLADLAGRLLLPGAGMQAGVMVALIGAPAMMIALGRPETGGRR